MTYLCRTAKRTSTLWRLYPIKQQCYCFRTIAVAHAWKTQPRSEHWSQIRISVLWMLWRRLKLCVRRSFNCFNFKSRN